MPITINKTYETMTRRHPRIPAQLHTLGSAAPHMSVTECSAEQKIAYNIAQNLIFDYAEMFNRLCADPMYSGAMDGLIETLIDTSITEYESMRHFRNFNSGTIRDLLNKGLKNYFLVPFEAHTYAEISRTFPVFGPSVPADVSSTPKRKYADLDNLKLRKSKPKQRKCLLRYYLYYNHADAKPKILRVDSPEDKERLKFMRKSCIDSNTGAHIDAVSRRIAELLIEFSLRPRPGLPLLDIDEVVPAADSVAV